MKGFDLSIIQGNYCIHFFESHASVPSEVFGSNFFSVTKTGNELSVVCEDSIELPSNKKDCGWSCIKVLGPLDLALTGILAKLLSVLAQEEISIFAISTFDTDFILVKSESLKATQTALSDAGYAFT